MATLKNAIANLLTPHHHEEEQPGLGSFADSHDDVPKRNHFTVTDTKFCSGRHGHHKKSLSSARMAAPDFFNPHEEPLLPGQGKSNVKVLRPRTDIPVSEEHQLAKEAKEYRALKLYQANLKDFLSTVCSRTQHRAMVIALFGEARRYHRHSRTLRAKVLPGFQLSSEVAQQDALLECNLKKILIATLQQHLVSPSSSSEKDVNGYHEALKMTASYRLFDKPPM